MSVDAPNDAPQDPRRRASLRGRGWEILRGISPPEELPEEAPQELPADAEAADVSSPVVSTAEMAAPPEISASDVPDARDYVTVGGKPDAARRS